MKTQRFTFLCTEQELNMLNELAKIHYRSKSDLIRVLIRETFSSFVSTAQITKHNDEGKKSNKGGKHNVK